MEVLGIIPDLRRMKPVCLEVGFSVVGHDLRPGCHGGVEMQYCSVFTRVEGTHSRTQSIVKGCTLGIPPCLSPQACLEPREGCVINNILICVCLLRKCDRRDRGSSELTLAEA